MPAPPSPDLLFLNSSIPQPRFRKPVTPPTSSPTITSEGFPLFHAQLRVLLAFLLISYPLSTTRRAMRPYASNLNPPPHLDKNAYPRPANLQIPGNPEKHPCFPRAFYLQDEYNQEEEKTATSAVPQCVVECGQCWNLASGVNVALCQLQKLKSKSRPRRGQRWKLP